MDKHVLHFSRRRRLKNLSWPGWPARTDTHGVVLPDVTADVQQQLVADVDGEVDGPHAAGEVTASHQAGLQPRALKHR